MDDEIIEGDKLESVLASVTLWLLIVSLLTGFSYWIDAAYKEPECDKIHLTSEK